MVRSYANANHTWKAVLGELIDNAFDAGATSVTIRFGKGDSFISVEDNGAGSDDLAVFFDPGTRKGHKTNKIGCYGVGAKEAAFWIGGVDHEMSVCSVRDGKERKTTVDWGNAMRCKKWPRSSIKTTHNKLAPSGTTVRITPVIRNFKHGKELDAFLEELGYMYSAAIRKGCSIRLIRGDKDICLSAWKLPAFEGDIIEKEVDVGGGKLVRIKCGIVKEGEINHKSGLTYYHGVRVVLGPTHLGCGDYGASRICGVVDLKQGWALTKNKDFVSRDTDKLFAAVQQAIMPLLLRAQTAAQRVEMDGLSKRIESILHADEEDGPNAKAKRRKGEKTGTVEPVNTGRRHRRAARIQIGTSFTVAARTSFRFEFANFGPEGESGRCHASGLIQLNEAHPHIAAFRKEKNEDAIILIVLKLLADSDTSAQLPLFRGVGATERFESLLRKWRRTLESTSSTEAAE
jgi:hypothetical protein